MTATVTSKFRNSLWIAPFLLSILVSVLIAICVSLAEENIPGNAHMIMTTLAILIGLICFNTYRAVKRFIKVTVSPDALLLHYLLINEKRIVNYADIVHIGVVRETTDFYGIERTMRLTLIPAIKLKIELNTGKNLYLVEEYYKNFDELKEAIWCARFKLD